MPTLQDGIEIAKLLEPLFRTKDRHIALGGSCLYKGTSEKDVDIIIYKHTPFNNEQTPEDVLNEILSATTFTLLESCSKYDQEQQDKFDQSDKEVWKAVYKDITRVDFIFVN